MKEGSPRTRNALLREIIKNAMDRHGFKYVNTSPDDLKYPFTKGVGIHRGGLRMDFYPSPDLSEFTVLISKSERLIKWVSSKPSAEELREINGVLGFDLIEKPVGQETGAGTVKTKPLSWGARVIGVLKGSGIK